MGFNDWLNLAEFAWNILVQIINWAMTKNKKR